MGWVSGDRFPAEVINFYLFHTVETLSETQPDFYPMVTGGHPWELSGRDVKLATSSIADVNSGGAIPPPAHLSSRHVLN
jgi:hypothetical protein